MGVSHSTAKSFKYALTGAKTAFKDEPNFRIHTFFAIAALLVGFFLKLNYLEWIVLSFTIFYVITLELLNTVLENIVNVVSPQVNPYAKAAKDVAAACVLLAAFLSVIVGLILFVPKLLKLF